MKWLWGEKKQEKTPLNFTAKPSSHAIIRTKVKVIYELDVEYPSAQNIVEVLRDITYDFHLPGGVIVHNGTILTVEVSET